MERKDSYRVIIKEGTGEIVEKKSRFIATVKNVGTEEEGTAFLEAVRKKYWDATHNCHAMIVGERGEIMRSGDDGEPSGTAGRPMLEVLMSEKLRNVAVVVTRYFGGTLLGTGGLVRAYTQALKAGLAACEIGCMQYGALLELQTDYGSIGKVLYTLENTGITPLESEYTDSVSLKACVTAEKREALIKALTEATAGRMTAKTLEEGYYIL